MKPHLILRPGLLWALAALLTSAPLAADVVETANGARIVGKIVKIDSGNIYMSTDYAGDIVVKQSQATSIATDGALAVRLASGTRIDGIVTTRNGTVQIVGADGTVSTSIPKIAEIWTAGEKDPAVVALERHWKYEATADIVGTSGNHNQLGTGATFSADLAGPQDELKFYTAYDRQVTDGVEATDQFKAGVDYASNFGEDSSWFVRDEGGFDRILAIQFYDTAAAGVGYNFVKNAAELLTGRVGLAYQYTGYDVASTPTVSSPAADFELSSDLKMKGWELVNKLTAVPTFGDFKDYIATQDSYWQIPLANPAWKLRIGVSNNYDSQPPAGIQKLDTTYYTHLILDWQ